MSQSPRAISEKLEQIIASKHPNLWIDKFIQWILETYITRENLQASVNGNLNIIVLAFNHYNLGAPVVSDLFRIMLRMFWDDAMNYMTYPQKIYNVIAQKPECKAILDTPQAREYLNNCCRAAVESLWIFAFPEAAGMPQ